MTTTLITTIIILNLRRGGARLIDKRFSNFLFFILSNLTIQPTKCTLDSPPPLSALAEVPQPERECRCSNMCGTPKQKHYAHPHNRGVAASWSIRMRCFHVSWNVFWNPKLILPVLLFLSANEESHLKCYFNLPVRRGVTRNPLLSRRGDDSVMCGARMSQYVTGKSSVL